VKEKASMKKVSIFGFVLMIVAVLSVAGFAGARGDTVDNVLDQPEGTFGFIYDGYCDGMTLTFNTGTGITSGTYSSACGTCPYPDAVGGTVGVVFGQGVTFSLSWDGTSGIPLWTVIRTNRTFTHYNYDGSVFLNGTWTPCTLEPQVPAGAGPSTAGAVY
jgi:hypothetical protein